MVTSAPSWTEVAAVFEECLGLDADRLGAYLESRCQGAPGLRHAVEALLRSDRDASSFLGSTAVSAVADCEPSAPAIPAQIGPYEVVRPLGAGGLGEIFLARRNDGAYERQVAVKLLHGRVGGAEAIRRLHEERQILAQLNHPNIAQLHDGGQADDGRPYLVMEYVDGLPIDAYCQSSQPGLDERIRLFQQLCSAAEYAHRHLVVHRDLKPSNVLVTREGQIKLLDFGIAKQLTPSLDSFSTLTGGSPMTLAYASPEQILGRPVTTASDVHGLGVMLYLLLTGRHPFLGRGMAPHVIAGSVCTEAPTPPSRVAARCSEPDPATLWRPDTAGAWSADLDAIALRALEKMPEDRYATAQQLHEDVESYLCGKPVRARAASLRYRAWKLLLRHRKLALAAAALGVVLAGFLAALVRETARTERALVRAEQESRAVREVSDYLVSLFQLFDPNSGSAVSSAAEMLDYGVDLADTSLTTRPVTRSEVFHLIGTAYYQLGLFRRSEEVLGQALALRRELHGAGSSQVAQTLVALGRTECRLGEFRRALPRFETAASLARQSAGDPIVFAEALDGLGIVHWNLNDFQSAERYLLEARSIFLREEGEHSLRLAETTKSLATVVSKLGRTPEAKELLEEVLAIQTEKLPPHHPDLAMARNNYGAVLWYLGDNESAVEQYEMAAAIWRGTIGPDYPGLAAAGINVGALHVEARRFAEAHAELVEALRVAEANFGPAHPLSVDARLGLGSALVGLGRPDEAESQLTAAEAALPGIGAATGHPLTAQAQELRGLILQARGRTAEAGPAFAAALDTLMGLYGDPRHAVLAKFCDRHPALCRELTAP